MSKVVILWFNFSSSTSYPHGPVSSGMSLYKADLANTEIGESRGICNCRCLQKRSINVVNRRNTYLDIKNIRTLNDKSAVDKLLKIDLFYRILCKIIQDRHPHTFDFEGRNMAVFIDDGERFDDLAILEAFKTSLAEHYKFEAPINMSEVDVEATDVQQVNTIPFMNIDDECIARFTNWAATLRI